MKNSWGGGEKILVTPGPSKLEWADYFAVQAECGNLSGNELTRNSSGNARSQSSQLAEPLWTDPYLKSGITLRELISTSKKEEEKKSAGGEWIIEHFPQILAREEKATWNVLLLTLTHSNQAPFHAGKKRRPGCIIQMCGSGSRSFSTPSLLEFSNCSWQD